MSTVAANAFTDASGGNTATINGYTPGPGNMVGINKIINGAMDIAQRGTSFATASTGAYSLDRFQWVQSGVGVVTISQQTDSPSNNEFQNSLRITVTPTADTTIAAGDIYNIQQQIEGFNSRDLIGRTFTLSFWVRSAKTGTHCVAFVNNGTGSPDRSYILEYTVSVANTWEYKTVTVSGGLITAGTWNWTNGSGVTVCFALAAGSTFQTTAGAWQTGNFRSTSNQVNCLDTVGNIFAITGVQLEAGSAASPFEHRPYGTELALCQRYYEKYLVTVGTTTIYPATPAWLAWKVTKRASPTVTTTPDSGSGAVYTAYGPEGAYQAVVNSVGSGATVIASIEL